MRNRHLLLIVLVLIALIGCTISVRPERSDLGMPFGVQGITHLSGLEVTGAVSLPDESVDISALNDHIITVCGDGCDYSTLSAAVSGASSGDLIWLLPGSHVVTSVVVDKSLTIYARDARATATYGTTLQIVGAATEAEIIGGTWTAGGALNPGMEIYNNATAILRDVTLYGGDDDSGDGGGDGLYLDSSANVTVYNSLIQGGADGAGGAPGVGMEIYGGAQFHAYRTRILSGPGSDANFGLLLGATGVKAWLYDSDVIVQTGSTSYPGVRLSGGTTLYLYDSRVSSAPGGNAAAVDIFPDNTGTAHIYGSLLIGHGTAAGAVTCVAGTTVRTANNVTNISPITEATDCTDAVGSGNVVDTDVSWTF
ncbi:MAG: hypothetical protein GXP39_06925 [Chloroflexi bacterium]|nr:hypothetical protein [Chloroflexota bacterium]